MIHIGAYYRNRKDNTCLAVIFYREGVFIYQSDRIEPARRSRMIEIRLATPADATAVAQFMRPT